MNTNEITAVTKIVEEIAIQAGRHAFVAVPQERLYWVTLTKFAQELPVHYRVFKIFDPKDATGGIKIYDGILGDSVQRPIIGGSQQFDYYRIENASESTNPAGDPILYAIIQESNS